MEENKRRERCFFFNGSIHYHDEFWNYRGGGIAFRFLHLLLLLLLFLLTIVTATNNHFFM